MICALSMVSFMMTGPQEVEAVFAFHCFTIRFRTPCLSILYLFTFAVLRFWVLILCVLYFFTFTVLHGEAVSPLLVSISAMLYPFTLYTYFHLALLTINLSSHKKPQPQPCIAPHCIAGDRVAGVINNRLTVWSCNKERSRSGRRQNYKMKIVNWNVMEWQWKWVSCQNQQRCLKNCHC